MEELLNKLIEKGWKPFDVDVKIKRAKCFHSVHFIVRPLVNFVLDGYAEATVPLRELVSKESWLWQFVCEYVLIDIDDIYTRDFIDEWRDYIAETYSSNTDYEYWVLRSALCDEDKLEQFLLDNIKIDKEYTEEEQELLDLDYWTWYTKKFVK